MLRVFIGGPLMLWGALSLLASVLGAGGAEDDIRRWLQWMTYPQVQLGVSAFLFLLGALALAPEGLAKKCGLIRHTREELEAIVVERDEEIQELRGRLAPNPGEMVRAAKVALKRALSEAKHGCRSGRGTLAGSAARPWLEKFERVCHDHLAPASAHRFLEQLEFRYTQADECSPGLDACSIIKAFADTIHNPDRGSWIDALDESDVP